MFKTKVFVQEKDVKQGTSKDSGNTYTVGNYRFTVYDDDDQTDVLMTAFGNINNVLEEGAFYDIGFKITKNEYNGKLYNKFKVIFANKSADNSKQQNNENTEHNNNNQYASSTEDSKENPFKPEDADDLPF